MYSFLYFDDPRPKFCTKCRSELEEKTLTAGYDKYTGEEAFKNFLMCRKTALVDTHHDVWELIPYEIEEVGGKKVNF